MPSTTAPSPPPSASTPNTSTAEEGPRPTTTTARATIFTVDTSPITNNDNNKTEKSSPATSKGLMERYKAQTCIIMVTLVTLALLSGIVIGYFIQISEVTEGQDLDHAPHHHGDSLTPQRMTGEEEESGQESVQVFKQCHLTGDEDHAIRDFLSKGERKACEAAVCRVDLPRVYVVYKLHTGHIDIDGKLDERAWQDVPWTDAFVDIEGENKPAPRFETKVKLRYDDSNLYIGAHLQEYAVWANRTLHDTTIYQDNSFQVLLDAAQCNHKYKEISINALGTVADLMLTRPYMDDGEPLAFWESEVVRAVHIEGPVNDPTKRNKYWTVEMAVPFKQLYAGLGRDQPDTPLDREIWRANFVRSEWQTEVVGSKYLKKLDVEADWWVWHSPGVANIHIPDKWGLLQFRDVSVNSTSFQTDKRWITQNALLDVYRAQKAYKAVTGRYTDKKELLDLPPYVLSKKCIRDLDLQMDWGGFRVTARPAEEYLEDGHTRTDRLVWFGEEKGNFFRRRK